MNKLKLEVMTFKYLLKNITFAINDLNYKMDLLLQKNKLVPDDKRYLTPLADKSNDIFFDMYSISKDKYEKLVNEFGLDVTVKCCIALDDYVRDKGYMPYGNPSSAIKRIISINVMKDRELEKSYEDTKIYDGINFEDVKDPTTAKKYILSVPYHKRNISPEVIELIERFELTDLDVKK